MSAAPIDYGAYSTVLFMDSMVALEGKSLTAQPWHEIDATGPILVLVVPQVSKEIDKRKRDGRLGQRARAFNRLIAPAAESEAPVRIVDGPPMVDLAIAACERISWDALDDLDPEEPDDRVVAQVLHARGVPPARKLLFSQDTNPIAMASRHGIKVLKMPEHWLLEPEPSPHEKELSRLKARVRELEADEPELSASVACGIDRPLPLYQVKALTAAEQERLRNEIIARNPKEVQETSPWMPAINRDYSYSGRYKRYRDVIVPRHVATLHKRIETHYSQIPFSVRIENGGHIQAENLVVAITAIGGTVHDRFVCYPLFEPIAPQPRTDPLVSLLDRTWQNVAPQVGRHEMDFTIGPNRGGSIEVHCADFRHGRVWTFEGVACIDCRAGSPFRLAVELTASNLRGKISESAECAYTTRPATPDDLFDLGAGGYRTPIPMAADFDQAAATANKGWFDFANEEDEEDEDEGVEEQEDFDEDDA